MSMISTLQASQLDAFETLAGSLAPLALHLVELAETPVGSKEEATKRATEMSRIIAAMQSHAGLLTTFGATAPNERTGLVLVHDASSADLGESQATA